MCLSKTGTKWDRIVELENESEDHDKEIKALAKRLKAIEGNSKPKSSKRAKKR